MASLPPEQPLTAGQGVQEDYLLDLNVLSPSTEVERSLLLPALPASTTVLQLKLKIRELIPSRPQPERQRLIYRGRVLTRDNDSLFVVFGRENVSSSAN